MKKNKIAAAIAGALFVAGCFSGMSANAAPKTVSNDAAVKKLQAKITEQESKLKGLEAQYKLLKDAKPYPGKQVDVVFMNEGMKVAATITYPSNLSKKCPAVVLLPGYLGERDELPVTGTTVPAEGSRPEGFWQRAAEKMADAGYVSIRIDYRGSGRSDGLWKDCTALTQLSDAKAALSYISENPAVDKSRIAIGGISEGGSYAACLANDPHVKAVVLWSAAPDFNWVGEQVPKEKAAEYTTQGAITISQPWGEDVLLTKAYVDSCKDLKPLDEIAKFKGPLLSLCGLKDEDVTPQPDQAKKFIAAHGGKGDLVTVDADHTYNNFVGFDKVDEAIKDTVNWLNNNL